MIGEDGRRTLVWSRLDGLGVELCYVSLRTDSLTARGSVVATVPQTYRLEYELQTGSHFITRQLEVRCVTADYERELRLERSEQGHWQVHRVEASHSAAAGIDPAALADAVDCDIGYSPLTNTMPIRRHQLHRGSGQVELVVAWVQVPELLVYVSSQRYCAVMTNVRSRAVQYKSGDFTATLSLDNEGFVVDYPGLAKRVD